MAKDLDGEVTGCLIFGLKGSVAQRFQAGMKNGVD